MQNLYVNNTKITNPNFRGFNFVHQLFYNMPDKLGRVYTEDMIQQDYDALKKMRVKIIRSFYGGSLCWDKEKNTWDFENEHMQAFYKNCKDMEKLGIDIGITPQWHFSGFLRGLVTENFENTVSLGVSGFTVENDIEATAKNFEKFIELSVKAFEDHDVNNIKYLFAFTECNNTFNGGKDKTLPIVERREYDRLCPLFDRFITALDQGLKNAGKRDQYKIVAPCDNWRADDGSEPYSILVKYCLEHLADKVDIIGSHNGYDRHLNYTDDRFYHWPFIKVPEPMERSKDHGKEFWIDEYNPALHGNYTSAAKRTTNADPYKGLAYGAMVNSIMNLEDVSNVMIWAFADQQWPDSTAGVGFDNGVLVCGYFRNLLEDRSPQPAWYATALVSRYVGAGKLYKCRIADKIYVSAIEREDGEITVVVTNYSEKDQEVRVNFEKSLEGRTFYRYVYNPETIVSTPECKLPDSDETIPNVGIDFVSTMPKMSMAVFTTEAPGRE